MRNDDGGDVRVSVDVAAKPATVWRCITEADLLSSWLAAGVEFRAEVGSPVRIRFDGHRTVVEGEVVEVVEGRRLSFTWGVASGPQAGTMPAGSTRVTIALEPSGAGTRVTLTHAGLPEAERRDHEGGWREYAKQLAGLAQRL